MFLIWSFVWKHQGSAGTTVTMFSASHARLKYPDWTIQITLFKISRLDYSDYTIQITIFCQLSAAQGNEVQGPPVGGEHLQELQGRLRAHRSSSSRRCQADQPHFLPSCTRSNHVLECLSHNGISPWVLQSCGMPHLLRIEPCTTRNLWNSTTPVPEPESKSFLQSCSQLSCRSLLCRIPASL